MLNYLELLQSRPIVTLLNDQSLTLLLLMMLFTRLMVYIFVNQTINE
jgi:hypothetical protein